MYCTTFIVGGLQTCCRSLRRGAFRPSMYPMRLILFTALGSRDLRLSLPGSTVLDPNISNTTTYPDSSFRRRRSGASEVRVAATLHGRSLWSVLEHQLQRLIPFRGRTQIHACPIAHTYDYVARGTKLWPPGNNSNLGFAIT